MNGVLHCAICGWEDHRQAPSVAFLSYGISGATFGHIAVRVILSATFCGKGLPEFPWEPLLPCAVCVLTVHTLPLPCHTPVVFGVLLWQVGSLALFFYGVCSQIAVAMGIPILGKPPGTGDASRQKAD